MFLIILEFYNELVFEKKKKKKSSQARATTKSELNPHIINKLLKTESLENENNSKAQIALAITVHEP